MGVGLKKRRLPVWFLSAQARGVVFSVGLGSCERGIEKTATSGVVSVCACAVSGF